MKTNHESTYTIVYVFGPESCHQKYYDDTILKRDAGEWLKIGETTYNGNINEITEEKMRAAAVKRIRQEARTGIPVTAEIFDLFIFPHRKHTDDQIRNRLCDDLFDIESSKRINEQLSDKGGLIPAGREFVYGVCRSNIKYAVQSFDHDLIVSTEDEDLIREYVTICRLNDIVIDNGKNPDEKDTPIVMRKPNLDIDLILEVDAEVTLSIGVNDVIDEEGKVVTARYIGAKQFECRGYRGSSSGLAKKFINLYKNMNLVSINGNDYWKFKGKKLSELRKN